MKRPKWSARLLYIAVALALVIGLTPVAAMPVIAGHADLIISGPAYAKEMETVTFEAEFTPVAADSVTWTMPAGFIQTGGGTPNASVTGYFETGSAGTHTITAVGSWGNLDQTASFDILIGVGLIPQQEYNIIGHQATFCVPDQYNGQVLQWRFEPSFYLAGSWSIVSGGRPREGMPSENGSDNCVTVSGSGWGELVIYADVEDGEGEIISLRAIKKWGKIYETWLHWKDKDYERHYGPGSTQIFWNENDKEWQGSATLCDFVIGNFITDGGFEYPQLADGADVQWWVMDARAPVYDLPSGVTATVLVPLVEQMQADYPSRHVGFGQTDIKHVSTSTEGGEVCVDLVSDGQEAVKIVVVAKYPDRLHWDQWPVFPQIQSWNFWSQQVEKVPQVAWAGEKVVLEKQFGTSYTGYPVVFNLENQSVGSLISIDGGWGVGAQQVETHVDSDGIARVIVESESPGEAHINCALYYPASTNDYELINQHGFVVYFLKLEGITLGNVQGERTGHDDGLFEYPDGWTNPWDPEHYEYPDLLEDTLNVSQDTLLRARVKGWFMGDNLSWRESELVDLDGDGHAEFRLPEGRWVLPDDWPFLAGGRQWQQLRPHWDIMTQPDDNVMSLFDPLGDYTWWDFREFPPIVDGLVAEAPVIGPYSTLDDYSPFINQPDILGRKTIVRNEKLNWWDCPMPPAKVGFVIEDGPGYFKAADKAEIYYEWIQYGWDPGDFGIAYTNPFYQMMIPGNEFIPPFINNGGYDWDSFGFEVDSYGPYPFWEFINTNPGITPSDPQHPTWVWVYSDNHGEAMVYLNGDWNLDLAAYSMRLDGPHDITTGTEVGDTTVAAVADYPYLRGHPGAWSNHVEKTWTWGVDIRGNDPNLYPDGTWETDTRMVLQVVSRDDDSHLGNYKMAFLWVADRDGQPVEGAQIDWVVSTISSGAAIIPPYTGSPGLAVTVDDLHATNGFLTGTDGVITDGATRMRGTSYTRMPTGDELYIFNELWPGVELNHGVAAVMVYSSSLSTFVDLTATIHLREGTIDRHWNIDFAAADPVNPHTVSFLLGDANNDGDVDAGDITMLKRLIFEQDFSYAKRWMADVNGDTFVDAGDITALKSMIFSG